MTEKPKEKPELSPAGKRKAGARQERLAAALRANLGRRKAQARERADGPPGEGAASTLPSEPRSSRGQED